MTMNQPNQNNHSQDQILEYLRLDGKLLAVTHFFPDGDALGSLLAFSGMLDQLGVEHIVAVDDVLPDKYSFLPGFDRIRSLRVNPFREIVPRMAVLDAGALARIGSAQDCIGPNTRIINIDHHHTGDDYGHLNLVEVNASATAEILYRLCSRLKLEITPQIAYGLYIGILTDTGRFRYSNTTHQAMDICGDLISKGVNPGWVVENIYYNLPFELVQALARALLTLELHFGGLVCMLSLNRGHYVSDTEGFVEYAASIKGVALAAFVCELEEKLYKVSLRSRCSVDVSQVAQKFGGGGHIKAAGFRFNGTKGELVERLLVELGNQVEVHNLLPGAKFTTVSGVEGEEISEWILGWSNHQSEE